METEAPTRQEQFKLGWWLIVLALLAWLSIFGSAKARAYYAERFCEIFS